MARFMRRRWIWCSFFALTTAVVGWVFLKANESLNKADIKRARRQDGPIPVRTALVVEKPVDEVIGATALSSASETASIRIGPSRGFQTNEPLSEMVIKTVRVRNGDHVAQGQTLFELDKNIITDFLAQQEASFSAAESTVNRILEQNKYNQKVRELDVAMARAEVKFRNEDLDRRKREYEITYKLSKSGGSSTLFQLLDALSANIQAKFSLAVAEDHMQRTTNAITVGLLRDKEHLAQAKRDLETAKTQLEQARRDFERCLVKSPISGFVLFPKETEIVPGQVVQLTDVLIQVLKLDPIHVIVDFPQERIDDLTLGQRAEVVLDSFAKETFFGSVVRIPPQVNPALRVLPIVVELKNPNNRIKAGISGFARLHATKKIRTVPTVAVHQHGSKTMVFRVEDGRARLREVRTGNLVEDGVLEVREGLASGDEVIIYSNFYPWEGSLASEGLYLQDNDQVATDWRKWARRD